MCAGAALSARVAAVVYGARSPLLGADGSWIGLLPTEDEDQGLRPRHSLNPEMVVRRGVLAEECQRVMVEFFRSRRSDRPR